MSRTNVIKCKCMNCSLHFAVYSWNEEWLPVSCPECNVKPARFMVWKETSPDFIFQHVPGNTPLVGMPGA